MASIFKRNLSRKQTFIATGAIFLTLAFMFPMMTCGCSGSRDFARKTKIAAQVRQIAMAVENYYSDYKEFPTFENLNKHNVREKVYYSGPLETHLGEPIIMKTDKDFDGRVIYNNEKIEAK
ncbi:MAG: hypothetical protein NE330_05315, partial [Lentisphaeraceae bacterium]|nr:hypothetical protein [Lentisphaeraceae bacterium]